MRAPFQTLIILYKECGKEILYGVFLRKKEKIWQFISGGGENDESPNETAIRELKEETGIDIKGNELIKLESSSTIPVVNITGKYTWGENVFVVPEYSFAINVNNRKIILSDEHKAMQWMHYNEAISKLKYDSNKTALWELNERINISK